MLKRAKVSVMRKWGKVQSWVQKPMLDNMLLRKDVVKVDATIIALFALLVYAGMVSMFLYFVVACYVVARVGLEYLERNYKDSEELQRIVTASNIELGTVNKQKGAC